MTISIYREREKRDRRRRGKRRRRKGKEKEKGGGGGKRNDTSCLRKVLQGAPSQWTALN